MGPSHFPSEVQSTEDNPDITRWSRLALIVVRFGTFVADVVFEIPFTDEFFDFILEYNALFGGVADIFLISVILVQVSFGVVPS